MRLNYSHCFTVARRGRLEATKSGHAQSISGSYLMFPVAVPATFRRRC